MRDLAVLGASLFLWSCCAVGAAPTLFSNPAHESAVRGDPGDLLLLPGYGFSATDTVTYQMLDDTTEPLVGGPELPATSDSFRGLAPVVSALDVPDSLTVRLPEVMQAGRSYALWVRNAAGEWSNGVRINDARPLWITPDTAYSSTSLASLPRELKVVGRNLNPAPAALTQVSLHGPADFTLPTADDGNPATAIENYVARVTLPANLPAGNYSVAVSRDGRNWMSVRDQTLTVFPDPLPSPAFDVGTFGGCIADDGADDTPCIAAAIAAAKAAGGGVINFGPGTWDMNYAGPLNATGPVTYDGVLVPVGVSLTGGGAGVTIIRRGTVWNATTPNFALQGNNTVRGITFSDANIYSSSSSAAAILRLGVRWYFSHMYNANDPVSVSGITVTGNTFDKPFIALADGGMPIDHLIVTHNEFGAYFDAISLIGDGNNVNQPYRVDDSIIAFNSFKPGSYSNPSIGQGSIATQTGAGFRLDFSNNTADGAATDYLYDPVNDPRGWRAAHFWSERGNNSEILVSQNVATCTGDKAGDGEAITTDGGSFSIGLASAQQVISATATSVTIPGPLLLQQGSTTLPGHYFIGDQLHVAAGPGKGQVRRVVSYPLDAAGQPVTPVTLTVFPAWDVVPQPTSTIALSREYWQFYIVDNFVDQRQPLCTKGNANKPAGGIIGFYGQTADSVIEGNQQHDTSGINLGLKYSVADSQAGTSLGLNLYSSVEIRGNTVDGEYDWPSSCSWGGISVTDGASPTAAYPPPVEGYGISIAHNTVNHADGLHGGAIDLTRGWFPGPSPSNWPLDDNVLIFANVINNVVGAPATVVGGPLPYSTSAYKQCANDSVARIGIHTLDATVWNSVLSGNTCNNVATNLVDGGTGSQRVCSSQLTNSCECPSVSPSVP